MLLGSAGSPYHSMYRNWLQSGRKASCLRLGRSATTSSSIQRPEARKKSHTREGQQRLLLSRWERRLEAWSCTSNSQRNFASSGNRLPLCCTATWLCHRLLSVGGQEYGRSNTTCEVANFVPPKPTCLVSSAWANTKSLPGCKPVNVCRIDPRVSS